MYDNVKRQSIYLSRKFTAIPLALTETIILIPLQIGKCAVAMIALTGAEALKAVGKMFNYDWSQAAYHSNCRFKVALYSTARTFQLIYGAIATIFNDRYGMYHRVKAISHLNLYNFFNPQAKKLLEKGLSAASKEEIRSVFTPSNNVIYMQRAKSLFAIFTRDELRKSLDLQKITPDQHVFFSELQKQAVQDQHSTARTSSHLDILRYFDSRPSAAPLHA